MGLFDRLLRLVQDSAGTAGLSEKGAYMRGFQDGKTRRARDMWSLKDVNLQELYNQGYDDGQATLHQ